MNEWNTCARCRWWNATERTAASEWTEAECRKRAPFPAPVGSQYVAIRQFSITKGMDGCGDHAPAGKEVYRADYAEELGPWIRLA